MQKLFVFIIALLTLLSIGTSIYAQEATTTPDNSWPIEERCIGEPTKPSKGWSYDGTILMTGYAGIHGVNAKWDTPHVLAAASPYVFRAGIADGSAGLSSDKKWYATFESDTIYSETYNHLVKIKAIVVYSTINPKETYRIPWKNSWLYMWGPRRMLWKNNSELVYEQSEHEMEKPGQLYVINPFEATKFRWTGKNDLAYFNGYPSSSDAITSYQYVAPNFERTLKLVEEWGLYTVPSDSLITTLNIDAAGFAVWSQDSNQFITQAPDQKDNSMRDLVLFNQNGVFESNLMSIKADALNIRNASWSQNGDYLAFLVETDYRHRTLYVADMRQKRIFDLCLSVGKGLAWSPDGSQLAFFLPNGKLTPVAVMDWQTQSLHIVGYHLADWQDYLIGWSGD